MLKTNINERDCGNMVLFCNVLGIYSFSYNINYKKGEYLWKIIMKK
mgnify:CR=1 FL=1